MNTPRNDDAVLGGQQSPATGLVLGGKAGTLHRLAQINTRLLEISPRLASEINRIRSLGEKARFKDFKSLKVGGKDELSPLSLAELCQRTYPEARDEILSQLAVYEEWVIKSCLRWHLRGLPTDLAIRKVKVDLEVGANVTGQAIESFGLKETGSRPPPARCIAVTKSPYGGYQIHRYTLVKYFKFECAYWCPIIDSPFVPQTVRGKELDSRYRVSFKITKAEAEELATADEPLIWGIAPWFKAGYWAVELETTHWFNAGSYNPLTPDGEVIRRAGRTKLKEMGIVPKAEPDQLVLNRHVPISNSPMRLWIL